MGFSFWSSSEATYESWMYVTGYFRKLIGLLEVSCTHQYPDDIFQCMEMAIALDMCEAVIAVRIQGHFSRSGGGLSGRSVGDI